MKLSLISLSVLIILALTSCAPFKPSDNRAAICNEINSQLIFNGNTSDVREAEIQSSEQQLLWRSYEKNKCDEV